VKFASSQIAALLEPGANRRNLRVLGAFLLFLLALVLAYTVLFHVLMQAEGQRHSWLTGLYWTLTVMSTLGFGDITFQGDLGRAFSLLVLVSGVVLLLVVLPFGCIQFIVSPWIEAQSARRTPRGLPEGARGHVLITHDGPIARALIQRLVAHGRPYWVLEHDVKAAMDLHDAGVHVVLGERDDIATYRAVRAEAAALVVATGNDFVNTNTVFTVHELAPAVPIVSVVRAPESVDILELAGAAHVLQVPEMLGQALARLTLGGDLRAAVIGRFGELVIAEAPVTGTPLVDMQLGSCGIRERTGLTVVGFWKRGHFSAPTPTSVLTSSTALVLAGTNEQLERFASEMRRSDAKSLPVVILGGGRVGRSVANALRGRDVPYLIVEKEPSMVRDPALYVTGNAADLAVLEAARIRDAVAVVVTTNDDDANIYLTLYVRKLRPDVQIVSRATLERNVSTLHRAGADFVLSYAAMGANAAFNVLEGDDVVMLAQGLDVFREPVPPRLVGRTLAESSIRETTGCSVVALETAEGTRINPPADTALPAGAELILIGTTAAERTFLRLFTSHAKSSKSHRV
jgi:voltage-gated potassium channel